MKAIKCDLGHHDQAEIHLLADRHFGDKATDWELTRKTIDHVLKTPNAFCVLGGDLMDAAIKTSIGDTYGAEIQIMEQLQMCVKLFKPLADEKKVLCAVPGNHEERIWRQDGLDVTALMCSQMGIIDRYANTSAVLMIRVGRDETAGRRYRPVFYSAYVNHGSGGGKKVGAKFNRLSDLAQIVDTDIYLQFHTHQPGAFRGDFFRVNGSNSSVAQVGKLFVSGAAALNYGGYGDRQAFTPSSKISPIVYLSGKKRWMWANV